MLMLLQVHTDYFMGHLHYYEHISSQTSAAITLIV